MKLRHLFFVLCVTLGVGAAFHSAEAFTVTDSFNVSRTIFTGQDWRPSVFINTPYGSIKPGSQFFVEGDIEILACHNKPSYVSYQISTDGTNWTNLGTVSRGSSSANEHYAYTYADNFRCGTGGSAACISTQSGGSPGIQFTATTTPGTYRIYIRVLNDPRISTANIPNPTNASVWNKTFLPSDNELNYGWVQGYQEYTVEQPALPPSVNLSASPLKVAPGQGTTLTWTASRVTGMCTASSTPNLWNGNKSTAGGSEYVGGITSTTTFNILCRNTDGNQASDSVVVGISPSPDPQVSIRAVPMLVETGQQSTLYWRTENVNGSCYATSSPATGWAGTKAYSNGSETSAQSPNINAKTTFNISCTNTNGKVAYDSVTIDVGKPTGVLTDIEIERVGQDGTTASAPLGTYARLGTSFFNIASVRNTSWPPFNDYSFANEWGHWNFDEGVGYTAFDQTKTTGARIRPLGNVGNIDLSSNANYVKWVPGKSGTAVQFINPNSTTEYAANMPDEMLRGARAGTISMWVRWDGVQNGSRDGGNWSASHQLYGVVLSREGYLGSVIGLNGSNPSLSGTQITWRPYNVDGSPVLTSAIPGGVGTGWRHLVITFTSRTHKMYVDGVLQGTYTFSSDQTMNLLKSAYYSMTLGALRIDPCEGYDPYYFTSCPATINSNVTIDELRVYRRALDSGEVTILANPSGTGDVQFGNPWVAANIASFNYLPAPLVTNTVPDDDWGGGAYAPHYGDYVRPFDESIDVYDPPSIAGRDYVAWTMPNNPDAYTITAGWCAYNKLNATGCTVTSYPITPDCRGNACSVFISMQPDVYYCGGTDGNGNPTNSNCTDPAIAYGYPGYTTKVSYKFAPKDTSGSYCRLVVNNGRGWDVEYYNYPNQWMNQYGTNWPTPWTPSGAGPLQAGWTNQFSKTGPYYIYSQTRHDLQNLVPSWSRPYSDFESSYGEHMSGYISTSTPGDYFYKFQFDNDYWIYVDNVLQPKTAPQPWKITLSAGVPRKVDIYHVSRGAYYGFAMFAFDKDNPDNNESTQDIFPSVNVGSVLVRRVGDDGRTNSVPVGKIKVDNQEYSTNEQFLACMIVGPHTILASKEAAGVPQVGACKYAYIPDVTAPQPECSIDLANMKPAVCDVPYNGTTYCRPPSDMQVKKINGTFENQPVTVEKNVATKVVFKYVTPVNPTVSLGVKKAATSNATTSALSLTHTEAAAGADVVWTSVDTSACSITRNGVSWGAGANGTQTASSLTPGQTYTFLISCIGTDGSTVGAGPVTVTVQNYPTASVSIGVRKYGTANPLGSTLSLTQPEGINPGALVSWSSSNVQPGSCMVTLPGATSMPYETGVAQYYGLPPGAYTVSIGCLSLGGASVNGSATVTVVSDPPTATIGARKAGTTNAPVYSLNLTYTEGTAGADIVWSSTNASSCSVTKNGVGWTSGTASTQNANNLTGGQTHVFTVTCSGPGGTVSSSANVVVAPSAPPTATIGARKAGTTNTPAPTLTLAYSEAAAGANVIWSSTNATSCTVTRSTGGTWSGISGTQTVSSLAAGQTYTYSVTCTGPGGTINGGSATVTVQNPPVPTIVFGARKGGTTGAPLSSLSLTATQGRDDGAEVVWQATNVQSGTCTVDGVVVSENGSAFRKPLPPNSVYNLTFTCMSLASSPVTRNATITVGSDITTTCTPDKSQALVGQPVTWTISSYNPSYNYAWTGSDGLTGTNVQLVTKTYSTPGNKTAEVSVDGGDPSTCRTVNNQPFVQVVSNPKYIQF